MNITPELIDGFKDVVTNPDKHGLPKRPMSACFEPSTTITAKHILAANLISDEYPGLPKLILYIIMDEVYGFTPGADKDGNAGYYLQYLPAVKTGPEGIINHGKN